MFKDSETKKAKKKLEIKELAQIATDKINENKVLLETLFLYQTQINNIKKILDKKSQLINTNSNMEQTTNLTTNQTNATNVSENDKKENNNEQNINLAIKNDFILLYQDLKNSVDNLKDINKKLLQKYETNYNIIFDESSLDKLDLNKNRIDIFILDYELKQKNDIIKKLNESVNNSRRHSIFREMKRETETNRNSGTNYLNTENLYSQRDLQYECRHYNKCINRLKKKEKNIEKFKKAENYFENIIKFYKDKNKNENKTNNNKIFNNNTKNDVKASNFFSFNVKKKKSINNKRKNNYKNVNDYNSITINELGKKYQFEEDLNINEELDNNNDQTYFPNNNQINELFFSSNNLTMSGHLKPNETSREQEKNQEMKQKLNFLTVDELFDLDNEEGEKEVIIQEELHSDDEVIFEKKIKNKNRVNTKYLDHVKKLVPRLYLNQIEFNKKKVMNEADLYSFQRREYNKQNLDENIKTMKKKIKTMNKRININNQKLIALNNFIIKAKEQYNSLKTVKVLFSMKDYDVSFMKKEFYNYRSKKNNNNVIDEVDEKNYATQANKKVGLDEEDSYDEDAKYDLDDIDNYSDEMRKKKGKIEKENNKNNYLATEADYNEDKKNKKGKKHLDYPDDNRAKSK